MKKKATTGGARVWYFPDGYLPKKTGRGAMESHEALMLLNTGTRPARVLLDFYFEDKPPVKGIPVDVKAERVKTLRLDNPCDIGGLDLPRLVQYSLRIRSNVKIVAQFGRLDVTQPNLSYYVGVGYSEA